MKLSQLIEYSMSNIFFEKSYTKYGWEARSRHFYKKSKLSISMDKQWEMLHSLFLFCSSRGLSKYIKTKVLTTYFNFEYSFSLKKVWNLSSYLIFWMIFEENCFSCYILLTEQISLPDCLFFLRYWAICVLYLLVCKSVTS